MDSPEPPPATTPNTPARRTYFNQETVTLLAQAALSALVLLLVCNWHGIYEEDQLAKTAQIISLDHNANWKHYPATADYYSKDLFSSYFLLALAFRDLTGLPALESLNFFSVLCGVIFFSVTPLLLKRVFQFPPWLMWFVLISSPILVISFTYGNEAALALATASLAAVILTFEGAAAACLAGVFFVISAYGRSDYLLLWPALSLLRVIRTEGGAVDWRKSVRNIAPFFVSSAALGLVYLGLVLHHLPVYFDYKPRFDLKLFAAFFVYSSNPVQFLFALVGFAMCLPKGRRKYLLALPVCVQFLPYVYLFFSPKYSLPTNVVILIFAVVAMLPLYRRRPMILLCILAVPWLVAVTPFGIFGPKRAPYWYVPTDDGPLPAGGYLTFYAKVKSGFYQHRYDDEYKQFTALMVPLANQMETSDLVGYFNVGTINLWAVQHESWSMPANNIPFWRIALGRLNGIHTHYMIKTSYLYGIKQSPVFRDQFKLGRDKGHMQAGNRVPGDPFPDFIVMDDNLESSPADRELGKRIQFMNAYFQGNQTLRQSYYLPEFRGVTWIERVKFNQAKLPAAKSLYQDSEWVCVDTDFPNGVYYSMRFPLRYASQRQPLE